MYESLVTFTIFSLGFAEGLVGRFIALHFLSWWGSFIFFVDVGCGFLREGLTAHLVLFVRCRKLGLRKLRRRLCFKKRLYVDAFFVGRKERFSDNENRWL